jgi:hypothetical protein
MPLFRRVHAREPFSFAHDVSQMANFQPEPASRTVRLILRQKTGRIPSPKRAASSANRSALQSSKSASSEMHTLCPVSRSQFRATGVCASFPYTAKRKLVSAKTTIGLPLPSEVWFSTQKYNWKPPG